MAEHHKPAFLFVGNHPAVDLLNTTPVLHDGPVELLGAYEDLVCWVIDAGLVPSDRAAEIQRGATPSGRAARGDATLREIKGLREALRSIVTSIAAGRDAPPAAVEAVNASLRRDRGYLYLRDAADRMGFDRRWQRERDDPATRVIAPVARSILDLLTQPDLTRIRKCENPACVLWFLDTSKNGARRWCSMDLCGNRMKVAAHYRRHRANVTGPTGRPPKP